jgi:deoxycytidylate deaminase
MTSPFRNNTARSIIDWIAYVHDRAVTHQCCLRKAVGAGCFKVRTDGHVAKVAIANNGPSAEEHVCTNEVGKCGCAHAEPRAILAALRAGIKERELVMLSSYSPCTNCANIIVDSGLVSLVVYDVLTEHDPRGLEILTRGGVAVATKIEVSVVADYWVSDPENDVSEEFRERLADLRRFLKEVAVDA